MKKFIALVLAVLMLLAVLAGCAQQSAPAAEQPEAKSGRLLLFTTKTCPKCVMAKKFLADAAALWPHFCASSVPAVE